MFNARKIWMYGYVRALGDLYFLYSRLELEAYSSFVYVHLTD
jgi:hypothetical protein